MGGAPGQLIAGGAGARPDHPVIGHRLARNPAVQRALHLILAARGILSQTPFATRAQHAILVFERTNPDDRRPVIATFDERLDASAAHV